MMRTKRFRFAAGLLALVVVAAPSGCGWRGLNSLPLPGTEGGGPGSFEIQVQLPNATNLQPNSRVRVADVTVGTVTKIERQGWHALLTMRINPDVDLPANATATIGQTSLLGSLHVELAPPKDIAPQGKLGDGSLIPLSSSAAYPTTEQTLAAISMVLNGGGIGQLQDITKALSTAFRGREQDLRSLIGELDKFISHTNEQTDDIIAATDSLNNLVAKFADKKPVVDNALRTIPDALAVLKDQRDNIAEALDQVGKFSALAADSTRQTKEALVKELKAVGPVLESLANAGPNLTRSLSLLATFPFPNETLENWMRGDYANMTAVVDLTLSRIDAGIFTGTRWEGDLTELEMQWGRTIGQFPSPYTAGNPLTVPYRWDQGP
ncbi:virulence factor Mce family protein [Mycobacterium sp.]|uniref:virulence factor Mce family protein n=1 Tax=Mycobacterium sp. TaxID=1785 RepID=UPI002B732E37|nr:virulence factor Mce family protein [Mycobacterium sp.]HKP44078.1 virulence factor Mce family protein [Mycobacterium sp.]